MNIGVLCHSPPDARVGKGTIVGQGSVQPVGHQLFVVQTHGEQQNRLIQVYHDLVGFVDKNCFKKMNILMEREFEFECIKELTFSLTKIIILVTLEFEKIMKRTALNVLKSGRFGMYVDQNSIVKNITGMKFGNFTRFKCSIKKVKGKMQKNYRI